jgi:hypothetical protein
MMTQCKNKISIFLFLVVQSLSSILGLTSCKFAMAPKAPPRIGATETIIIPESVVFERGSDNSVMTLNFETRVAANCQIGFYSNTKGPDSLGELNPCAGRSATKFEETISGLPKDELVSIIIISWPTNADEKSAGRLVITEATPTADLAAINLLAVDIGGGRLELSTLKLDEMPSTALESTIKNASSGGCSLSSESSATFTAPRVKSNILSATSRGFINVSTNKINDQIVGGSFGVAQRQSTEWNITARTGRGYGQLRVNRPTLLASVIFAGREQADGNDDYLEDIDPPALKLSSTQTFVASWTVETPSSNATATLNISPQGTFKGITCKAPASSGKITIPPSLISQLPLNERLWASLRLDSWQPIDEARWLVRVSDWKSIGVYRL